MDVNQKAYDVFLQSIGEKPVKKPNPRAAKRGTARAEALSPEKRTAIARAAAEARWKSQSKRG